MSKEISTSDLRVQAKKEFLAGKYDKALKAFSKIHQADPKDLRVHVKVAELCEKTGDTATAVRHYIQIGNFYAEDGFVVQAIAINKIILRLDPSQTQVQERLQSLSSERGGDWAINTTPASEGKAQDHEKVCVERTPLLSDISGKELETFIDSLQLKHVDEGDYIYKNGDVSDALYLIGMGNIILRAKDDSGKKKIFSHLSEGDFFGERAFMSRRKHTDEALAETDGDILMIDRSTFDAWVEKHPDMQSAVESFYRERVLARLLAITPVFTGVPQDARAALANLFQLRTFQQGETIIQEGETGSNFYLIRSGQVLVQTSGMKDKATQVTLGEMGEGNFFGEVALITDKPRTATVLAKEETELMVLTRSDFNDITKQHPSIRDIVESYQKKRVQDTIKTLLKH